MYLSVLEPKGLNPTIARGFIEDEQILHQLLTGIFEKSREEEGLLYKKIIEKEKAFILMQSASMPNGPGLDLFDVKTVNIDERISSMSNGDQYNFRIITSPYVKKEKKRKMLENTEKRLSWLKRKAKDNGFEILNCKEQKNIKTKFHHSEERGGKTRLSGYEYNGELKIIDVEKFINGYKKGIGPNKAYGFGMLILSQKGKRYAS